MAKKTDWRTEYENLLTVAVDGWYIEAFKNPNRMYIYHVPAAYPAWGRIVISHEKPADNFELSTLERIPFAADKRIVRNMITRLQLPIIGE